MKILFVLHQYFPRHLTGTEQYARSLARTFRQRDQDVRVFAFEPLIQYAAPGKPWFEGDEEIDGVPVHRFSMHPKFAPNRELADFENPLVTQVFARYLARETFDAVHVFHLRNLGVGVIRAAKQHRLPVVVNLMDFWFLCGNFLLLRGDGSLCDGPPDEGMGCIGCLDPALAEHLDTYGLTAEVRRLRHNPPPAGRHIASPVRRGHALAARKHHLFAALLKADRIVSPSRFLRSVFVANGFPPSRVEHVPYGLDPERFAEMPERKAEVGRPQLDIGYIGSITRHKGLHVLLDAVARIEDERLRLHVHGSLQSQPGYSDRLAEACHDPRVVFHGPFEPSELGRVLASLDLLVVPSLWYENTPFSVLEALHCRVPVLASDLGGIVEIVHEGRNGMLFQAGDAEALAAALRRVLERPDEHLRVHPDVLPPTVAENAETFLRMYHQSGGAASS